MRKVALVLGAFSMMAAMSSFAATEVVLNCTPPTTRTDNSVLAAADIGSYFFNSITPPDTVEVPYPQQTGCSYTVPIPANQCFRAGTVFGVRVSDTLGQLSDPGTATLSADACNYLPKPSKPTVTITVQ